MFFLSLRFNVFIPLCATKPQPHLLALLLLWSPLIKHLGSQRLCAIITRLVLIFTCCFVLQLQSVRNCLVAAVCYSGQYSPLRFISLLFVLTMPPRPQKNNNLFVQPWMNVNGRPGPFCFLLDNLCQCWRGTLSGPRRIFHSLMFRINAGQEQNTTVTLLEVITSL